MPTSIGLVVDDDHQVRQLFARAIRREGMRALEARSGLEALDLAQTSPLDFIVTDIEMPDMDGLELCRRLRQLTTTATIPIVVVTGAPRHAGEETAAGCDVVLAKPCSPTVLLETIQHLLANRPGSRSPQ